MRLRSLEMQAFRGFGAMTTLDLDADVVLLVGRNGFGKSTVFDAISWCLFGSSKRFGGTRDFSRAEADYITNAFRRFEEPRVRLTLSSSTDLVVERTLSSLTVFDGQETLEGAEAQVWLLERMGYVRKQEEPVKDLQKRACDSFIRSFLLHQELLSSFVTSDRPRDRFDALADLFSLTPIKDFYQHLVTERTRARGLVDSATRELGAASAQASQVQRQLQAEEERASILSRQVATRSRSVQATEAALEDLFSRIRIVIPSVQTESRNPLGSIDAATAALKRAEESSAQDAKELRHLHARANVQGGWVSQERSLMDQLNRHLQEIETHRARASAADARTAELDTQIAATEQQQAVRTQMAESLRDLLTGIERLIESDVCPVCLQPIERTALLASINQRLVSKDEDPVSSEQRVHLVEQRSLAEQEARDANLRVREGQLAHQETEQQLGELRASMSEFVQEIERRFGSAVSPSEAAGSLVEAIDALDAKLSEIRELIAEIDRLRIYFEVVETRERLTEFQGESRRLNSALQAITERAQRYATAAQVLDNLIDQSRRGEREMLMELVRSFIRPIRDAYRWLSPHPLFSELDFVFGQFDEAGELYFRVSQGDAHLNPAATFSAAQANALALSVFLALNQAQSSSPLQIALIDDPVQHMDSVNVLNLVDLLRSAAEDRQLIFSTSNTYLHDLLRDKLRPLKAARSLITHRFEALTEDGPVIEKEVASYRPLPRLLPELLERTG